jgi:hypothetical protein
MLTIDHKDARAELAADLHPDDAAELEAAGLDVAAALVGADCSALRWDGRLVALFGIVKLGDTGVPWMLSTNALDDVPRSAMAKISRQVVSEWQAHCVWLGNLVHCKNQRAIRFVQWLGFTVDNEPIGPNGAFLSFSWSADHV